MVSLNLRNTNSPFTTMSQAPNILHKVPRPVVIGELQTVVDYNVTPEQQHRRERMIDFLENECPVEAFVFCRVVVEFGGDSHYLQKELSRTFSPHCGTIGCAIGHSRTLFPEMAEWNDYAQEGVEKFGLTFQESEDTFTPDCRVNGLRNSLPPAGDNATPQQVATRLREAFRRHPAAI